MAVSELRNRSKIGICLAIFSVTLIFYAAISYKELRGQHSSGEPFFAPHYIYQARAFLQGKLHLDEPLPESVPNKGKYYVAEPPLPSLLMLPLVARWGAQTNDVIFTLGLGALNAVLVFLVLSRYRERGDLALTEKEILWMVAFFAFGTIHFYMSLRGRVWFTNQIAATTMTLVYFFWLVDAKHPILAGLFSGLAATSRATLALGALLYPLLYLKKRDSGSEGSQLKNLFLFGLPVVLMGLALMTFNYLRFGNPIEFGYSYIVRTPLFGLRYIPDNFYDEYLRLPLFHKVFPYFVFDGRGMSFFIAMPGFLMLFLMRRFSRRMGAFLLVALSIAFLLLTYQAAGFIQFGPRYTLDFIPYLFLFLSMGLRQLNPIAKFLIVLSIVHNSWGALIFPYAWSEVFSRSPLHDLFFK